MKNSFSEFGLLGMNRRNADYILMQNPRERYPLVDDKLQTKRIMEENGVPTPLTYLVIEHAFEIPEMRKLRQYQEFVVKPARGAEGRGILLITGREGKHWKTAGGHLLTQEDLEYHVTNILAGLYSLGGTDDACFVEYFIHSHPLFKTHAPSGVADVRIVLYRGVPVMGMLRLPTNVSNGKANLHQGAIGVGIDMVTGKTTTGVHKNRVVSTHPDTGLNITDVEIPFWQNMLEIASGTFDMFQLGYIGVDFVVDVLLGPLILEVNARPGLTIQIANSKGLLHRLKAVDALYKKSTKLSAEQRCKLVSQMMETAEKIH